MGEGVNWGLCDVVGNQPVSFIKALFAVKRGSCIRYRRDLVSMNTTARRRKVANHKGDVILPVSDQEEGQ